ncbi:MAG TPA: trypsin-like peptidase domain-containing protein [Intrasporangium sp.]|uniref:S1C family serine protease n=1 Tax=Intrasporangium sp. TaxID=1925024 RepID=UPI002B484426|nr:trypsin-like peptidase domain-containing protein [Intrasporangium sp.]HKX69492.1 trypsin-like peptidase domain-containing protein [Intrasporangium sp.]
MTLAPHDSQQPNPAHQPPDTSRTQEIPTASVPTAPPPPAAAPQAAGAPAPRKGRGLGQTAGVALLAAVLASGGTYALTQANESDTSTPTATTQQNSDSGTSPTVVQGNAAAPDWSAVAKAVSPSVVSIQLEQGAGSGVIVDEAGHIVTNNHVVEGAPSSGGIQVTLADGRTYDASIVGTDPSTDLAVIKLSSAPDDLTPITLGDSDQLAVGNPVMAIGNPLGLSGTVTTGIISALDRPVSTGSSNDSPFDQGGAAEPVVTNAIQTSAAINPGNSGGALVSAEGKLIGINSSIAQLGGGNGGQSGNIGIGFAIPVNEAKSIADQLIADGTAEHAFLGVSARDTVAQDGAAKRAGAEIAQLTDGAPAQEAGIEQGDIVVAIDGESVDSSTALVAQIRERKAGEKVTLTVIRDGKRQDVSVTLAARPSTTR